MYCCNIKFYVCSQTLSLLPIPNANVRQYQPLKIGTLLNNSINLVKNPLKDISASLCRYTTKPDFSCQLQIYKNAQHFLLLIKIVAVAQTLFRPAEERSVFKE